MVCKELSGKFVWQHILHFDNGSYASQERSECITKQLLQHADELSRFESLFITCTADGTNLNALIQRLAPQLRRFRRDIYTIFITDEQTLLQGFQPRILQRLELDGIQPVPLEQFFKSNSFPNLTYLAVSEDDSDNIYEVAPVRPLLQTIASSTGYLQYFELLATSFRGKQGGM
jgi:hypothetical protein